MIDGYVRESADTINTTAKMDNANKIMLSMAKRIRFLREEYADVIRIIWQTAPHEQNVAETLDIATGQYRKALEIIAQHLVDLDPLKYDMTYTAHILWFYFGYSGFFTLTDGNRCSYHRAETLLAKEAARSLLAPTALELVAAQASRAL